MGPLFELLATDERQALEFFAIHLQEVSGSVVDQRELLYNASVLAHHALVSTAPGFELSSPATLSAIFDNFVFDTSLRNDPSILETAGAQCLLLAGFFEDQMRQRHNIRWYAELGASFFARAAQQEPASNMARLLEAISRHFEAWRRRQALLSRELRVQAYVLGRDTGRGTL